MLLIMFLTLFWFQGTLALNTVAPQNLNESLQIKTTNGLIQGSENTTILGKSYFSYLGIPYAKPPVNELRFKSPKRMSKWTDVLDATIKAPCCAGLNVHGLAKFQLEVQGEEDCLYLNLFTPKASNNVDPKTSLPVMVFLHGGGFIGGCANSYGPDFLIENDVVLVIPNYRISVFGFLSTEDLECPGNWAIKDQIAVLNWVQLNIRKFGGNPEKVTVFGQSAGSAAANTLLLSTKAKNLLHGTILISGPSLGFWAYQKQPKNIAFDFGLTAGIEANSSKSLLEQLRKSDQELLKQGQIPVIVVNILRTLTEGLPFTPVIEPKHKEAVITDYHYNSLEKGNFNRVPVMMGVTNSEMAYFRKIFQLVKPILGLVSLSPGSFMRISSNFTTRTAAALTVFKYFFNTKDLTNVQIPVLENFLAEDTYFRPSRKTATLIARYSPVYFYQFTYEGKAGWTHIKTDTGRENLTSRDYQGAAHGEELAYLFSKTGAEYSKSDIQFSRKLTKLYANFAKNGNPTPIPSPVLDNVTWPRITAENCSFLTLGEQFTVQDNFAQKNAKFWNDLYEKYADKPYKVY